jgi:hypothetical protein
MPWDNRIDIEPVEALIAEGPIGGESGLRGAYALFHNSRVKKSRPCYAREETLSYEEFGSVKLDLPLVDVALWRGSSSEMVANPSIPLFYMDPAYLAIQYPPTTVKLLCRKGNDLVVVQDDPEMDLCEQCRTIDFEELFEWGVAQLSIPFGGYDDLKKRDCKFCRLLAVVCNDGISYLKRKHSMPSTEVRGLDTTRFDPDESFDIEFSRNPLLNNNTKPFVVVKARIAEFLGPIFSLRTVRGDIRGEFTLKVNMNIDFDVLRRMIQKCDSTHGGDCGRKIQANPSAHGQGFMLIDIEKMCLAKSVSPDIKYTALSYVWGTNELFTTQRANIHELLSAGGLAKVGLCQTIQDAIAITRGLGLSFLWVDTLCIIQDDTDHKMDQIKRMAAIYGQSYLTIVALTGTEGRSRLPGISKARSPLIEVIRGMPITAMLSDLTRTALNQVYEQRAWTYQERLVSKRCLYWQNIRHFLSVDLGRLRITNRYCLRWTAIMLQLSKMSVSSIR